MQAENGGSPAGGRVKVAWRGWRSLRTEISDGNEEPAECDEPRKDHWPTAAQIVGKRLECRDGGEPDEKPKEEQAVVHGQRRMDAGFENGRNEVQRGRREQVGEAEPDPLGERCKARAGGASRKKGHPVREFRVRVDVPDTPIVRAKEKKFAK